jgi:hypothetical protein
VHKRDSLTHLRLHHLYTTTAQAGNLDYTPLHTRYVYQKRADNAPRATATIWTLRDRQPDRGRRVNDDPLVTKESPTARCA